MGEKKIDDRTLGGCGVLVLITTICLIASVVFTMVCRGRSETNKLLNDEDEDIIGSLRGLFILLIIIGIVYLVRKNDKN